MAHVILAINPGSTTTKIGLFDDREPRCEETLHHPPEDLKTDRSIFEQLGPRLAAVRALLDRLGQPVSGLAAVVGRGGLLPSLPGGTYRVGPAMLEVLAKGERGEHASNLGAAMADELARAAGCPAFIVDPVSVDEMWDVARTTGLPFMNRESLCHALNIRATAHAHAAQMGRPLSELSLIVLHLGGGCSTAAVQGGQLVDVLNPRDDGPMSADRAGGLPTLQVARWVAREGLDEAAVERKLFREGGLYAHLGTRDLREVYARIDEGDAVALGVVGSMVYQAARGIGGLAACLDGKVDGILLTGGMINEARLAEAIAAKVRFIAPVSSYPGENELVALAAGAHRVLEGLESARAYPPV